MYSTNITHEDGMYNSAFEKVRHDFNTFPYEIWQTWVFFMQAGLIETLCIVLMLIWNSAFCQPGCCFVCEPISLLISAVAYFGPSGGNKVDSFPK